MDWEEFCDKCKASTTQRDCRIKCTVTESHTSSEYSELCAAQLHTGQRCSGAPSGGHSSRLDGGEMCLLLVLISWGEIGLLRRWRRSGNFGERYLTSPLFRSSSLILGLKAPHAWTAGEAVSVSSGYLNPPNPPNPPSTSLHVLSSGSINHISLINSGLINYALSAGDTISNNLWWLRQSFHL